MKIKKTLFPIEVDFNEEKHEYKNKDGKVYISASQLIKKFSEPFDSSGEILKRCSLKEGISEEELKKRWEQTGEDARNRGTGIHFEFEKYVLTGKINKTSKNKDILEQFSKIPFTGELFSEHVLFSHDYSVAGTTDLLELLPKNKLRCFDFKSNKSIPQYTKWAKRMHYPIDKYFDTPYWKYVIQMGLYAFMLEEMGFWVEPPLIIYWINLKKRILEPIELPFVRDDIVNLLHVYKTQILENPPDFS